MTCSGKIVGSRQGAIGKFIVTLFAYCYCLLPFLSFHARAENFVIADGDVAGLISAIEQANQNNEPDTIYLALKGRYVFVNPIAAIFDGYSALPSVILDQSLSNSIVVYGNGSALERDPTAPPFRIWTVGTGSLVLHDLVIRNGYLDGLVSGNYGGGISNYGVLAVYNSTFVNNTGSFMGGALYISVSSPTELVNCTITGNSAPYGSAIYFFSSSASITQCTIVGNPITSANGAALYNALTLDDPNRRVFLKNSIVALNTTNDGTQNDVYGVILSMLRNIVGANNDPNAQVWLPVGLPNGYLDYVGTSASPVDPLLNTLADNGGLTLTMTIQSDQSLAFNNGGLPQFTTPADQAGNYRLGNAEIGSMEYNNNPVLNPAIEIRQSGNVISSPGVFDFGDVVNGQSSGAVEFKIYNTGFFHKLNLLGKPKIILAGANADDFVIDQSMTAQEIAGGSETSFFVTFLPSSPGTKEATVFIASNDTGKTIYTIELTGESTSNTVTPVIIFTSVPTEGLAGEEITIAATSDSPAEITFEITGGTGTATFLSPSLLRLESPGTVEITASQEAATGYEAATASHTITVLDQVTAVEPHGAESAIVFPNPAGSEITIKNNVAEKIYLVDARGVVVKEWRTQQDTVTLTIEGFSPGLYLLKGQRGRNVVLLRRVVKKARP
ncbi:MAG: choice-of-anchor D domain-containing protein [Cyclobacteriaceae bacterium]|nr:choice-of-anchor D domain-containing protein [Cyclobacteriaceae bacterium]